MIAFDFTNLHTRQANIRSTSSARVGLRRVTTVSADSATMPVSRVCTSRPPVTLRYSSSPGGVLLRSPSTNTRTLGLLDNTRAASADTDGAASTSTNCRSTMAEAVVASNSRLNAMIPPNADVGSVRYARSYASRGVAATDTPHGLACFTITHAASANWRTHSIAVSASAMLLNDRSLPC